MPAITYKQVTIAGYDAGRKRDRVMTTKASLLKVIRAKCLDCSGHQLSEIQKCTLQGCDLWPYRLGRDPNPARQHTAKNLAPVGEVFDGKRPLHD